MKNLGGARERDRASLDRLADQPGEAIFDEVGAGELLRLTDLEAFPDLRLVVRALGESVEHGPIADAKDSLDLEDSLDEWQAGGGVPFAPEDTVWHQEVACEEIRLSFLFLALLLLADLVFLAVEDEMPQLVGGAVTLARRLALANQRQRVGDQLR